MSGREHNPAYVNRRYQRGTHFSIDAKLSVDGKAWRDAHVTDLSSNGLLLTADGAFEKGDELWLDLNVRGFFNEFDFKVKSEIKRVDERGGKKFYGVAFLDLSRDLAIRIDENVLNDRPIDGSPYHGE